MIARFVANATKALLRKILPGWLHPNAHLQRMVRTRTGMAVFAGPFKGLKYVDESVGSVLYPKLLGTYEKELAPALRRIAALRLQAAIDVGAAEGYYAIGLLRSGVVRSVVAFEQTEKGRQLLERMGRLNEVSDRISIRGRCEIADLSAALEALPRPSLLVCDVEGYEETLLDPARVPALSGTYILAELHEFARRGITEVIRARFRHSHSIREFSEEPRDPSDMPFTSLYSKIIPARYFRSVTCEYRPEPMAWFWMEPRGNGPRIDA